MNHSIRKLLLAGAAALATCPAFAADVTPDRLANADKEPHNWLMNHRTYDAQRFSPLDKINKDNVKNLKLAFAVALGGTSANENLQATPLVEDGFMYIVDLWGVVYKIDVRSGDSGRIVWRMDPGQEKLPLVNRGAALWGNLVDLDRQLSGRASSPPTRTPARSCGKRTCATSPTCSSPPRRSRSRTRSSSAPPAATAACATGSRRSTRKTGKQLWRNTSIPAPGEPGSETWKDKNNAWQTGGGALWVTGSYDPATNQVIWGTGNPVPMFDPDLSPRRQPLHQQRDLLESRRPAR